MSSEEKELRITKLKHLRRGKKGSITKRVETINRIISEGGSRTKIKFLMTATYSVLRTLITECEELFQLMTEPDSEWLEDVKTTVDECAAEVSEYLENRRQDAPSTTDSLTDSWVRQYEPDHPGKDADPTAIIDQMAGMQITETPEASKEFPVPYTSYDTGSAIPQISTTTYSLFGYDTSQSVAGVNHAVSNQDTPLASHWGDSYWKKQFSGDNRFLDQQTYTREPLTTQYRAPCSVREGFNAAPGVFPRSWSPGGAGHFASFQGAQHAPNTRSIYTNTRGVTTTTANAGAPSAQNDVDSWIDCLDERQANHPTAARDLPNDITMAWFIQQTLPRVKIPVFDGSPSGWVSFITKFYNLVHKQVYLTDEQRHMYLQDHLSGEPKTAVKCYSDDRKGYVSALKALKFMFGQRSNIAQATLAKVTHGKPVQDDDTNSLTDFYYTVTECLVTLKQLNYVSDLHSSDTLRQTVRRLPTGMQKKWAAQSRRIRNPGEELNLLHFEIWLRDRVLDRKEACWPDQPRKKPPPAGSGTNTKLTGATMSKRSFPCPLCEGSHYLGKCEKYTPMNHEEKIGTVQRLKLCYNCIKGGHASLTCPSKAVCFAAGCGKKHHTSLHKPAKTETKPEAKSKEKPETEVEVAKNGEDASNLNEVKVSLLKSAPKEVFLLVVPVVIHPPKGKPIFTYAFLDNGSQSTLLREDMAQRMKLHGRPNILNVSTIKDEAEAIPVKDISLDVSSQDNNYHTTIKEVSIVSASRFNMPGRPRLANSCDSGMYTHLDGINLDPISPEDVTMLIGANVPEAVLSLEVRRGGNDQPLAVRTVFGWTLFGPLATPNSCMPLTNVNLLLTSRAPYQQIDSIVAGLWKDGHKSGVAPVNDDLPINERSDRVLHELVEEFWSQEVGLIAPGRDIAPSREDDEATAKLDDATVLVDGHYQVPMLWKNEEIELPNNIGMAHKRFQFLRGRLRRDPALYAKYKETFEKYVVKGYARRLSATEASHTTKRTWYLPHHPVTNPNKPGKVRIVKDAAALYKGKGLNASLVSGPDFLRPLPGVLIGFRNGRFAIAADVEEMFHQVRVSEEDADSLRFLWTDDISSNETYTLQMLVHIFGAKSSPTCANYALKRTARDNQQHFDPLTVETVLKSFYVDDLLKSVDSLEVARRLTEELISILKRGGFHLTKFMSNSKNLLSSLPPSEVSLKASFNLGDDQLQRALGVSWDIISDTFKFATNLPDAPETKRGILRVTSSLFDPLGFAVPFLLKPKLLLRELWRSEIGWDQGIDETTCTIWRRWQEMTKFLSDVEINRCFNLHDSPVTEIQLHVFADASELAYGPVAYLRFSYKDNTHSCSLVMSKSKLAPIKAVTLPRLELNAAVTAVRLYRNIIVDIDLPVERVCFWSDSTLVLQYINNTTHRFKTFIANRVTEITETSAPEQWRHVPGTSNPADLVTRGVGDPRLLMDVDENGSSWFGGPAFLQEDEAHWPKAVSDPLDENDPEIKRKPVLVALGLVEQPDDEQSDDKQHVVIDPERFSSLTRLTRVVGWVRRFIHNYFAKTTDKISGDLSCDEIDVAETRVVQLVQRDAFFDEMRTLDRKGVLPNKHKLSPLSPYIDDHGLLRVGGRLRNARIPVAAKNQMILPKDHPVTRLLIMHDHRKNGHVGREHVLANLREKYWILNGRAAVRYLLRRCFFCKIKRARRRYPFMADLPPGRLASEEPPFSNCGVDLFGPIHIKQGRKRLKRWGYCLPALPLGVSTLSLLNHWKPTTSLTV